MNARAAQTLLRCYRPGKAADARMDKAVRFAQEDAELSKSLTEQIEFDQQITDAIHFIKPPEDLVKKLNDLRVKAGVEKKGLRSQMINPAVVTAMLGVLVILGIVVFFVLDRVDKFPGREQAESLMSAAGKLTPSELEPASGTTGQLADSFYIRGYDGFEAPPDLAALEVVGSGVVRFGGQTVAQIAVGHENTLRCIIFEFHASEFGVQLPADADWKVLTHDEWVGAIRQHGDHCFLIVFKGARPDMQEFLKTLPHQ
jgi:hypothetical protein